MAMFRDILDSRSILDSNIYQNQDFGCLQVQLLRMHVHSAVRASGVPLKKSSEL
jgi:hypothetical protein